MRRNLGVLIVLTSLDAAKADVFVVPSAAWPTPQDAIDAAQDGDTILVQPSGQPYPAFAVGGKSVTIVGDGVVALEGTVRVANVSADQVSNISGFSIVGIAGTQELSFGPQDGLALAVEETLGPVRFTDCTFTGAKSPADLVEPVACSNPEEAWTGDPNGSHGAWLQARNEDVAFVRCHFVGGAGNALVWSQDYGCITGGRGGSGLRAEETTLTLAACTLTGGRGGYGNGVGGPGGNALHAIGCRVWSSASTITGGKGGNGSDKCGFYTVGGDGGAGLVYEESIGGSQDDILAGGEGGSAWIGVCGGILGAPGVPWSVPVTFLTGARSFAIDSPVREGELAHVSMAGEPGDLVLVFVSEATGQAPLPGFNGYLIAALPFLVDPILTFLPASGELSTDVLAPRLPLGEEAATLWFQALMSPDGTQAFLSSWSPMVLLDASF